MILAIDGLQPDVGHEVLRVVRDVLSGEILVARSLLSARQQDLADLLTQARDGCPVRIAGVVSDGQHSIRQAVSQVFPDVPYQLCQFHYLREAARPIGEADRHAKKELKTKVRTVRGIERRVEGRDDVTAEVVRGYCSAVRSALTDDGRPPLEASGLKLHDRLTAIAVSLDRVAEKGDLRVLRDTLRRALDTAGGAFDPIRVAFGWVHRAAHILGRENVPGSAVRSQLAGLLGAMRRHRDGVGDLADAVDHFAKVSRSYWPGFFACDDTPGLPRTNNDLEPTFGPHRYHDRRATGRKGASPGLVLRGSVRLVAGLATRRGEVTAADLAGAGRAEWRRVRAELEERRVRRADRGRFRRDPDGYLKAMKNRLNRSGLPA